MRLVAACTAAYSLATLSWWVQPQMIYALMAGKELSEAAAGYLVGVEVCAIAITALTLAPYVHVLALRRLCVIAGLVAVTGNGISMVLDRYPGLLATRLLTGIAEGCALATANSLLASTQNPEKEYSKAGMGSVGLGAALIAIAPLIQRKYSVTGLFAALAVTCLLLTHGQPLRFREAIPSQKWTPRPPAAAG